MAAAKTFTFRCDRMIPFSKKPEPGPERPHYRRMELSPAMYDELGKALARLPKTGVTLALVDAWDLAERIDLPYTPPVDWDALERKARAGYSIADQIFDGLAKRPVDPDPPETK